MRCAALCRHPLRSRALRAAVQLAPIAIPADAHLLSAPTALQQSPRLLGHRRHAERARLSGQTTRSQSHRSSVHRAVRGRQQRARGPNPEPSPFQRQLATPASPPRATSRPTSRRRSPGVACGFRQIHAPLRRRQQHLAAALVYTNRVSARRACVAIFCPSRGATGNAKSLWAIRSRPRRVTRARMTVIGPRSVPALDPH
jgi:hypothetical protein